MFSLTHKRKYKIKSKNAPDGIYCHSSYGPTFGGGFDFYLNTTMNSNNNRSNLGHTFESPDGLYQNKTELAGDEYFTCKEVEVF